MQSSLFANLGTTTLVDTPQAFSKLLERCAHAKQVGFDTESAGPLLYDNPKMINIFRSTLVGYSIAFEDMMSFYVPCGHGKRRLPMWSVDKVLNALPKGCVVWAHNWKHDYQTLKLEGVQLPRYLRYADSMVAAYDAHMGIEVRTDGDIQYRYGLKALAKHHLNVDTVSFDKAVSARGGILMMSPKEVTLYAGNDALYTLLVGKRCLAGMPEGNAEYFWEYDMPFAFLLGDMETHGIGLDRDLITETHRIVAPKAAELRKTFESRWGCAISSDSQVRDTFFSSGLWSPPVKTEKDRPGTAGSPFTKNGVPKVDAKALRLQAECAPTQDGRDAAAIRLEWRGYNKLISTYTWPLINQADDYPDRRLHGSFNQVGTKTGRLSSSAPNMQNIITSGEYAGRIKAAFIPKAGNVFVSADYSQLEYRILAHYAGGALQESYNSGSNDVHQAMADKVGKTRKQAKTLNFGIVYGMGVEALGSQLGMGAQEAKSFIDSYMKNIPEVAALKRQLNNKASSTGWIRMVTGILRATPGFDSEGGALRRAERQAFNKLFQGGAAEIAKIAMLGTQRRLGRRGQVVLQVHDEICVEVERADAKAASKVLQEEMERAISLKVPLRADPAIGENWGACK